jgi:hypothetical protein
MELLMVDQELLDLQDKDMMAEKGRITPLVMVVEVEVLVVLVKMALQV